MSSRPKTWVPLVTAATVISCAVGSELDPMPFSPAKDRAVQDSSTEVGPAADETGSDSSSVEAAPDDTADASSDDAVAETDPIDAAETDPDTAPIDSAAPETSSEETGTASDTGSDTGSDTAPEAPPDPPTVTIDTPASDTSISYSPTSGVCQGQPFTVTFAAPAGLASMQWRFVTPNAASATTGMLGTCTGDTAYAYFLDPAKYVGSTGAILQENVAIAGTYSGAAGTGRWWWCTPPGSALNAFVPAVPAPGTAGVLPLADYCSAKTTPAPTDLASRWHLEVTVTDQAGKTAVASLYFWVHQ